MCTAPRATPKASKNHPKTNFTKDYAPKIAEKQETIASLTAGVLPTSGESADPIKILSGDR